MIKWTKTLIAYLLFLSPIIGIMIVIFGIVSSNTWEIACGANTAILGGFLNRAVGIAEEKEKNGEDVC